VSVRGNALTQQRKSLIAREFGYSETVFVHDAPGPGLPRRIDIFTEQGVEIPFAGHPVSVGTAPLEIMANPARSLVWHNLYVKRWSGASPLIALDIQLLREVCATSQWCPRRIRQATNGADDQGWARPGVL